MTCWHKEVSQVNELPIAADLLGWHASCKESFLGKILL